MNSWIIDDRFFFSLREQSIFCIASYTDADSGIPLSYRESLLLNALLSGESQKNILIDLVWKGVDVGEGSYHRLLFDLRNKLQLCGLPPNAIRTIPRRGCTFTLKSEFIEGRNIHEWMTEKNQELTRSSHETNIVDVSSKNDEDSILKKTECDATNNSHLKYTRIEKFFVSYKKLFLLLIILVCICMGIYIENKNELSYHSQSVEGKKLLSIINDTDWPERILKMDFESGIRYIGPDSSVYYLCEQNNTKCENYIYISH